MHDRWWRIRSCSSGFKDCVPYYYPGSLYSTSVCCLSGIHWFLLWYNDVTVRHEILQIDHSYTRFRCCTFGKSHHSIVKHISMHISLCMQTYNYNVTIKYVSQYNYLAILEAYYWKRKVTKAPCPTCGGCIYPCLILNGCSYRKIVILIYTPRCTPLKSSTCTCWINISK